jgi:toxin ParE1/3/4
VKPVVLHDQAVVELEEAASWYERCRPGLGGEFQSAVEQAVGQIRDNPQIGFRYGGTRFRYVLVRRFPYVLFYSEGKDVVRVMAVAHSGRRPGYWMSRRSR